MPLPSQPLTFETPVGAIRGPVVVEFAQGEVALLDEHHGTPGSDTVAVSARYAHRSGYDTTGLHGIDAGVELGEVLSRLRPQHTFGELRAVQPVRAVQLAEGQGGIRYRHGRALLKVAIAGVLSAGVIVAANFLDGPVAHGLILAAFLTFVCAGFFWKPKALQWAEPVHRLGDRDVPLPELVDDEATVREAHRAVATIRERYGALLGNITARLELPALFDADDPISRRFHLAMLAWEDGQRGDPAALPVLAREVSESFAAAHAHATELGSRALPASVRAEAEATLTRLRANAEHRADVAGQLPAVDDAVRLLSTLPGNAFGTVQRGWGSSSFRQWTPLPPGTPAVLLTGATVLITDGAHGVIATVHPNPGSPQLEVEWAPAGRLDQPRITKVDPREPLLSSKFLGSMPGHRTAPLQLLTIPPVRFGGRQFPRKFAAFLAMLVPSACVALAMESSPVFWLGFPVTALVLFLWWLLAPRATPEILPAGHDLHADQIIPYANLRLGGHRAEQFAARRAPIDARVEAARQEYARLRLEPASTASPAVEEALVAYADAHTGDVAELEARASRVEAELRAYSG